MAIYNYLVLRYGLSLPIGHLNDLCGLREDGTEGCYVENTTKVLSLLGIDHKAFEGSPKKAKKDKSYIMTIHMNDELHHTYLWHDGFAYNFSPDSPIKTRKSFNKPNFQGHCHEITDYIEIT